MIRNTFLNPQVRAGANSFAFVFAVFALSAASAQTTTTAPGPSAIEVPSGNSAFLKAAAVGTQNYVCMPSASGGLAWTFQAPQATLFVDLKWLGNDFPHQVATHFLSPNPDETGTARVTWQSSFDSSAAWARKIAESSDPDFVAADAIPWVLLQVVGTRRGPTGGSMLSQTTFIRRINTTGGVQPAAAACTDLGVVQFVPYTADYVFYRASGGQ